jgi:hypothetical protein
MEKNDIKEIWVEIKNYEGLYEASNLGRVRNADGLILKQHINTHGYLQCNLSKNNVKKAFRIHRIIADSFIPNPKRKEQVNHLDGVKTNNYVNNLEWCTRIENMRHANENGLINKVKKLSHPDVVEIRENKHNLTHAELGKMYGVSQTQISRIIAFKEWNFDGVKVPKAKVVIVQSDPLGMITIGLFDSVKEASISTGVGQNSIRKVISGQTTTAGGFIWEKVDLVE